MESVVFNVSERNEKGKKVRMHGEVPAVLYGSHLDNTVSIKITRKDMYKLLTLAKNSILSLNLNGHIENCVVKELQKDPFGKIIHIDFQSISKGELVKLKIPVIFYGQEALEAKGLLLESFVNEVELQGEVGKFPDNISIDVSKLEEGNQILVRDLPISKDMVIEGNVDLAVAKISYRTNNVSEDESEE